MNRTLTNEDIEEVAQRVAALIGERLTTPITKPEPPRAHVPDPPKPTALASQRLAYSSKELCRELGISYTSLWRLEARGLLRSNPAMRHKLYSRAEVERFLALDRKSW